MALPDYKKEKSQLLQSLLSHAKKKGYIHAATILDRFKKYGINEGEKENIFQVFHDENIEIIFEAEEEDDPSPSELPESLADELKHDGVNSYYADPLQIYIKEIHRYPTLTHKETLELVRRIAEGDKEAREQLINCNLKYAFAVAAKYIRTGVPILDLIQQANIGLMKAADMYNPNRGTRFTTYSSFWMRHSILRYIDEQSRFIRLPDHLSADLAKIKSATDEFYFEFMRYPSDTEIADKVGMSIAQVKRIRNFDFSFVSTEEKSDEEMDGTVMDTLTDNEEPDTVLHSSDLRNELFRFLSRLNDRERTIIILRYGLSDKEPMSLEEVGNIIGLSRERVRQIESRALNKIRQMPNVTSLYDYLNH